MFLFFFFWYYRIQRIPQISDHGLQNRKHRAHGKSAHKIFPVIPKKHLPIWYHDNDQNQHRNIDGQQEMNQAMAKIAYFFFFFFEKHFSFEEFYLFFFFCMRFCPKKPSIKPKLGWTLTIKLKIINHHHRIATRNLRDKKIYLCFFFVIWNWGDNIYKKTV